jgi:hypothetical protein
MYVLTYRSTLLEYTYEYIRRTDGFEIHGRLKKCFMVLLLLHPKPSAISDIPVIEVVIQY